MNITNKFEMLSLLKEGRIGNTVRQWANYTELLSDPQMPNTVTIRYRVPNAQYVAYGVDINNILKKILTLESCGANRNLMFFNENPDDNRILIQGEIQRLPTGLYLLYSRVKKPMRLALSEQSLYAERTKARAILEHYLDSNSWDDIQELLDLYNGHVIEFSCYDYELGRLTHRNTIIWEVRKY